MNELNPRRGRPAKFKIGEIVRSAPVPVHYVIVDHRPDRSGRAYRAVEVAPDGSRSRGPALWLNASDLESTGGVARKPVRIFQGNQKEGKVDACQCSIHLAGEVELPEGMAGFIRRVYGVADRAGWSVELKNPSWLYFKPSGGATSATPESLVKGLRRAARKEAVDVKVSRHGGDIGITGDFSEAFEDGLLYLQARPPEPVLEPELVHEETDAATELVESLGWKVRARLPGEWWIVPVSGRRSAEAVAARLRVEVLRPAGEGVWVSAPSNPTFPP